MTLSTAYPASVYILVQNHLSKKRLQHQFEEMVYWIPMVFFTNV